MMNKALIAFAAIVAVTLAQNVPERSPYVADFTCQGEGEMVVDADNLCWYHQCVGGADGSLSLMPRRCALGSRISLNYVYGFTNPCTVNFDTEFGYECNRNGQPSIDGPPDCATSTVCENGGTPTYESNLCWCLCPPSWRGDFDCSKPTRAAEPVPPHVMCVEEPEDSDSCLSNPCLNGGVCMDVCKSYWCDCPKLGLEEGGSNFDDRYWYGKNCEERSEN